MKITYECKRYDSDKCEKIAEYDFHNYSNNYAETTSLLVASDGTFIRKTKSNGQDCHITNNITVVSKSEAQEWLQDTNANIDEDQEALAIKHGLIEIIN